MKDTATYVCNTMLSGTLATAATSTALACVAHAEGKPIAAPFNAISHILWGDKAYQVDQARMDYTGAGAMLNADAMMIWAGVHECLFGDQAEKMDVPKALMAGVVTAGLAWVVDYFVVPKRLKPGFEERLTSLSTCTVFTALALALGASLLLRSHEDRLLPTGGE